MKGLRRKPQASPGELIPQLKAPAEKPFNLFDLPVEAEQQKIKRLETESNQQRDKIQRIEGERDYCLAELATTQGQREGLVIRIKELEQILEQLKAARQLDERDINRLKRDSIGDGERISELEQAIKESRIVAASLSDVADKPLILDMTIVPLRSIEHFRVNALVRAQELILELFNEDTAPVQELSVTAKEWTKWNDRRSDFNQPPSGQRPILIRRPKTIEADTRKTIGFGLIANGILKIKDVTSDYHYSISEEGTHRITLIFASGDRQNQEVVFVHRSSDGKFKVVEEGPKVK
jgi:hypothetical protein